MPGTTDNKGITSGYTDGDDNWGALMNQNLRILSATLIDSFANDPTATTGLVYAYRSGVALNGGLVYINAGTVNVPPSTTGYIVRNVAGAVTFQTSPTFNQLIPLAAITTNVTNITSILDRRALNGLTQDGTSFARYISTTGLTNPPASTGAIRMGNTENITARNVGNSADKSLISMSSADKVVIDADGVGAQFGANVTMQRAFVQDITANNPGAANDAPIAAGYFQAGTDVTLGALYLQIALNPSANGANRYARIQAGDNSALRKLGLVASQHYIGPNNPTFAGGEQLRVQGHVYVDNTVTASNFLGSGVGLSGISESGVTNLISDLATLTTNVNTAQATANSAVASRPFATVINDNVPLARVAFPAGPYTYAAQFTGNRAQVLDNVYAVTSSTTAVVAGNYTTPDASSINAKLQQIADVVKQLVTDLKARGSL